MNSKFMAAAHKGSVEWIQAHRKSLIAVLAVTLIRRLTERVRWTLKYGFFNNRDRTSGGTERLRRASGADQRAIEVLRTA